MDSTPVVEDPSERAARAAEAHWKSQLTKGELKEILALDDRRSALDDPETEALPRLVDLKPVG